MIIDAHVHIGKNPNHPDFKKLDFKKVLNLLLDEMKSNHVNHGLAIAYFKDTSFGLNTAEVLNLIKGIKALGAIGSLDVLNYGQKDLDLLDELFNKK